MIHPLSPSFPHQVARRFDPRIERLRQPLIKANRLLLEVPIGLLYILQVFLHILHPVPRVQLLLLLFLLPLNNI